MATAYLEQQPGNRLTNLHCMKSKEAFMNGSKNIFNTVANLRVDRNLNLQEQIARRAYELWQARGSTSSNAGVIGFGRRARSTNGTSVVRARLLLAVPTNEPFLRCVGRPSMNESLSTEVRSLTSFQSRELSLINSVWPGSALRCGKRCVLARGARH